VKFDKQYKQRSARDPKTRKGLIDKHNEIKITIDGETSLDTQNQTLQRNKLISDDDTASRKTVEVIADELQPEYLDRTMKKSLRWVMLILCCLFVVGNYFCYDNPAALETYIEQHLDVTPSKYGLLYTVYAIPNTILPLVGGLFLDKIG
jgi:hypothetical protein